MEKSLKRIIIIIIIIINSPELKSDLVPQATNDLMASEGDGKEEKKLNCQIGSLFSQLEEELQITTAAKENSKKVSKDCLESLRQVADHLKDDEWIYPSVNKLLGLQ